MKIKMVCHNVRDGLSISSRSRSTTINGVCDSRQFVRHPISDVCSAIGIVSKIEEEYWNEITL